MTQELISEFASFPDDVKAIITKPEVLEAINGYVTKHEAPLITKRDELLTKLTETNKTIQNFGGLESIKTLADQAAEARRLAEEAAAKSTDAETVRSTYAEKLSAVEQRYLDLQNSLIKTDVDSKVSNAIVKAKGVPELLLPLLKSRVKGEFVDGQVKLTILGANGVAMLKDDGKEAGLEDLVNDFKKSSTYARAFDATNTSGSGAHNSHNNSGVINPWLGATKNVTKQMEIARENPALARTLAAAAGVTLAI